jgi:hypothetical protein
VASCLVFSTRSDVIRFSDRSSVQTATQTATTATKIVPTGADGSEPTGYLPCRRQMPSLAQHHGAQRSLAGDHNSDRVATSALSDLGAASKAYSGWGPTQNPL